MTGLIRLIEEAALRIADFSNNRNKQHEIYEQTLPVKHPFIQNAEGDKNAALCVKPLAFSVLIIIR
ncbi:hypothetical protein A4D02_19480 [Niastella koreensis]|uniref:Uncharacterized protein n=1 Tax=Niastella koreensis TaxID=354356 RepID=A0ABX3P6A5_9BACT|nr:hypothetical protein A4D02_19480 [Niastella koreensis]